MARVPFNSIFQKDGKTLTAYGFACGYVQPKNELILYKEHSAFHIKGYLKKDRSYIWETFFTLSEARKFYRSVN